MGARSCKAKQGSCPWDSAPQKRSQPRPPSYPFGRFRKPGGPLFWGVLIISIRILLFRLNYLFGVNYIISETPLCKKIRRLFVSRSAGGVGEPDMRTSNDWSLHGRHAQVACSGCWHGHQIMEESAGSHEEYCGSAPARF